MVKVRITDKGIIQEAGDGIVLETGGVKQVGSGTVSTTSTLTVQQVVGMTVLSSSAVITGTMPLAANLAGSRMIFRVGSAHAHVLTGSAEAGGTKVFCRLPYSSSLGQSNVTNGSKLVLPAVVGSSVALLSDGVNLLVLCGSGSFTLSDS